MEIEIKEEKKTYRTFVYGSLRRGEFNHNRFRGFPEAFQCEGFIRGAYLKSLGSYPAIVPTEDQTAIVRGEIYDLPEDLHEIILRMELGAGYEFRPVLVNVEANKDEAPGATVPIEASAYFFRLPERISNIQPVEGGDWTRRPQQSDR